jgi:hypothetical protein
MALFGIQPGGWYPNVIAGFSAVSTHTLFVWVYAMSASRPLERPYPLRPKPPNGDITLMVLYR